MGTLSAKLDQDFGKSITEFIIDEELNGPLLFHSFLNYRGLFLRKLKERGVSGTEQGKFLNFLAWQAFVDDKRDSINELDDIIRGYEGSWAQTFGRFRVVSYFFDLSLNSLVENVVNDIVSYDVKLVTTERAQIPSPL